MAQLVAKILDVRIIVRSPVVAGTRYRVTCTRTGYNEVGSESHLLDAELGEWTSFAWGQKAAVIPVKGGL